MEQHQQRIIQAMGGVDRWVYPGLITYLIISLFSSLGRSDVNVAIAMIAVFFIHQSDVGQRRFLVALLVLSYVIDITWLALHSHAGDHSEMEDVDFEKGIVIFAFVMSIFNMLLKVPLAFIIFNMKSRPVDDAPQESLTAGAPPGGYDFGTIGDDDDQEISLDSDEEL